MLAQAPGHERDSWKESAAPQLNDAKTTPTKSLGQAKVPFAAFWRAVGRAGLHSNTALLTKRRGYKGLQLGGLKKFTGRELEFAVSISVETIVNI